MIYSVLITWLNLMFITTLPGSFLFSCNWFAVGQVPEEVGSKQDQKKKNIFCKWVRHRKVHVVICSKWMYEAGMRIPDGSVGVFLL